MPIQLDKPETGTKQLSPKFFHKQLTGGNRVTGIFNKNFTLNPDYALSNTMYTEMMSSAFKEERKASPDAQDIIITFVLLGLSDYVDFTNDYRKNFTPSTMCRPLIYNANKDTVLLDIVPVKLILSKTRDTFTGGFNTKVNMAYDVVIYHKDETYSLCHYDDSIRSRIRQIIHSITYPCDDVILNTEIDKYCTNYIVYDAVTDKADIWENRLSDIINTDYLDTDHINHNSFLRHIYNIVNNLETYNVSLEEYKKIFTYLKNSQTLTDEDLQIISIRNTNLLMYNILKDFENNKNKMGKLNVNPSHLPQSNSHNYSIEQRNAILTQEPFTITQAVAGSGKSTVINARIQTLLNAGVKPEEILMLSFTNVAADNIAAKHEEIMSITIASMIHHVYEENFPKQSLSEGITVLNSIRIHYPKGTNTVADKLCMLIENTEKISTNLSSKQLVTEYNITTKNYYTEILEILDKIGQTTLELEQAIIYNSPDTIKNDFANNIKHVLIDEAQDTSVFEFIYLLSFVIKNNTTLYIVADASQCLYEFRSANPEMINILEYSGILSTYPLTTNYRSSPEVLSVANALLEDIRTNRFANLKLYPNKNIPITKQSFNDKISAVQVTVNNQDDLRDAIKGRIWSANIKPFIEKCLSKNQNVAILAHQGKMVRFIEDLIKHDFMGGSNPLQEKDMVNIQSKRIKATSAFTRFIRKCWGQVSFNSNSNVAAALRWTLENNITTMISSTSTYKTYQSDVDAVKKNISAFFTKYKDEILKAQTAYQAGKITSNELSEILKNMLIQHEISLNNKQLVLTSNNNNNIKANVEASRIITSTIHSAKGMEFDNTVVIYNDESNPEEDNKRTYYVALTRAIHDELIISYSRSTTCPMLHKIIDLSETYPDTTSTNPYINTDDAPEEDDIDVSPDTISVDDETSPDDD